MTNHTPCLLDEAATFMKVQYLSYLRFLSTDGRSRLAAFLETFDAAEYTLFQWNDAIEYLKAGVKQQTAQVARAQLLRALNHLMALYQYCIGGHVQPNTQNWHFHHVRPLFLFGQRRIKYALDYQQ